MNTRTPPALRDIEVLFRPFRHHKLRLASRLVMAPMSRNFAEDGIPTPLMAQYYRRRAENELGLIITEGAAIDDPASAPGPGTPRFYGGAALRAWKRICRTVHATGCKIIPQIRHIGLATPANITSTTPEQAPIGPSGIDLVSLRQVAAPMSLSRIHEVAASFARAAANARSLGFDGVEIQGAHGELVDQFLWDATNHRTDEYGGDLPRRMRFALEVVHAVRKAVGRNFPILFRISQWKPGHYNARLVHSPEELAELVLPLSEAGVDIFDCSTQYYDTPEFEGSPRTLAGWVRRITGKPVIGVGAVGVERTSHERLWEMLSARELDLIAIGRALLADYAWAHKTHLGHEHSISPFSEHSFGRLI